MYDGHAGSEAASFVSLNLHQNLIKTQAFKDGAIGEALKESFAITDMDYCSHSMLTGKKAGCTVVVCLKEVVPDLVSPDGQAATTKLHVAWAGDSQAILIKDGTGVMLTPAHKPDNPEEKERIESNGGSVIKFDIWRVNGTLAVSRSIGDPDYKPFVTCEPDLIELTLTGSEDYLILASDGLWDHLQVDEVTSIVYEHLEQIQQRQNTSPGSPGIMSLEEAAASAAEILVRSAQKDPESSDNITAIVVFLRPLYKKRILNRFIYY